MADMTVPLSRFTSSWIWLLALYTVAGFVEVVFWGQMTAFTPLYLPHLGVAPQDVARWTGAIVAISSAAVITLLGLGMLLVSYQQPVPSSTAVADRAERVAR